MTRIHELAAVAAQTAHGAIYRSRAGDHELIEGHSRHFHDCPHPDCVLVRAAVPVEEAAPQGGLWDMKYTADRQLVCTECVMTIPMGAQCYRSVEPDTWRHLSHGPVAGAAQCSHCKGSGNEPEAGFADSPCEDCAGAGAVPAPQWQPIETAPKDGTKVLIFDKTWCGNLPKISVSYWQRYKQKDGNQQPWVERGSWSGVTAATHWMPLPAPPRSEQDETQVKA